MFRPKLDAVSLLHNLSLKMPVRQFVLFSSISGLLGSRWLAHYAATTTFLASVVLLQPHLDGEADQRVAVAHQLALGEICAKQAFLHLYLQPLRRG